MISLPPRERGTRCSREGACFRKVPPMTEAHQGQGRPRCAASQARILPGWLIFRAPGPATPASACPQQSPAAAKERVSDSLSNGFIIWASAPLRIALAMLIGSRSEVR